MYAFHFAALIAVGDLDLLVLGSVSVAAGTVYGFARNGGDTLTITFPTPTQNGRTCLKQHKVVVVVAQREQFLR